MAAALLGFAGLAAPALASSASRARPGSWGSHFAFAAPREQSTASQFPYLAGYQVETGNDELYDATSFVVPKVSHCTSTETAIVPSAGFEFNGLGQSLAGLFVGCTGGKVRYFPVLVINGSIHEFHSLAAKPGDTIKVTAAESPFATVVSLTDTTHKTVHKTLTGAGTGGPNAVGFPWIGDLAWPPFSSSPLPVPNFGKIGFSGSRIDNLSLGSYAPALVQLDLYDSTLHTLEVKTGGLTSHGQSFKTTFVAP